MSRPFSSRKRGIAGFIHNPFSKARTFGLAVMVSLISISTTSLASEPSAKNNLPIRPNPTATVTGVCYKLGQKDYSQAFHAACYSEFNKAVVILISGNAKDISGQKIGQIIADEFSKKHVPAVVFLENRERNKVSISYLLNGDPYGPYSGHNWSDGFKLVKIHAGQAWYPKGR